MLFGPFGAFEGMMPSNRYSPGSSRKKLDGRGNEQAGAAKGIFLPDEDGTAAGRVPETGRRWAFVFSGTGNAKVRDLCKLLILNG